MSDTITITGNIAADPERRQTGSGVPVTTFRIASSQRKRDAATGQWVQSGVNWYSVSAFRQLGENAFHSLHKGQRVIVNGRLRLREWQTQNAKGTAVEIDADAIGHDLLWGTTQFSPAAPSHRDEKKASPSADGGWNVPGTTGTSPSGSTTDWPAARPGDEGPATGDVVPAGADAETPF